MISLGNFFFRYRNGLFPLAIVLLLIPSRNVFSDWRIAALVGVALVLIGQIIRAITVGLDYIVRGGRNGQVYAEGLVTGGMFQHCRNPLYVGNYLGILGAVVASNSLIAITVGGVFFLIAYIAITLAEENYLRGKFGSDYDSYCDRVPRFTLQLGGIRATLKAARFNWQRLLVKEYGTMFVSLAGIPLILLLTRHYRYAIPMWADGWDSALLVSIAVLLAGYLLARWLKKSGRITE
ncbi:MAG: hypothetical protein KA250_09400 [Verrucomicrobiales bacterium]|jgi:protein-S-isoprenylcysteine O-methyltransferase Ste14|nr:hypothetical protein [Verrucomicrobiales bacterium]